MNIANGNLGNLCANKNVLGRMDLVFSQGNTATQFQEYMIREGMEPFKDGKLDIVVFLKLYKLLLEGIIDHFKSSENQVAKGAERFPDIVLKLKELSKLAQESRLGLDHSLLTEFDKREEYKCLISHSHDAEKSVSRQFIMNSSISIHEDVEPLKIAESQELDLCRIESLESDLGSMIKAKRDNILPPRKSDIFKKLARSILSSRKKTKEAETENIFDENCPSFIMNEDDLLLL